MSDQQIHVVGQVPGGRVQMRSCVIFAGLVLVLLLAFYRSILDLIQLACQSDLQSHVLLIPFVSAYLIWCKRKELPPASFGSPLVPVLVPLMIGLVLSTAPRVAQSGGWTLLGQDYLCVTMVSLVMFLIAGAVLCFGQTFTGAIIFPLGFLVFLAPVPKAVENSLEIFYQHTSASVAASLFGLFGQTVFRDGLIFRLPGIVLEVARECSGIRSSLVLFITSWIAGYLYLNSPWRRLILAVFVVPLGIFRNGFRIFTIGMLCVHVSPDMINSWVHRKGGPLFFILSLLPFFALLILLYRSEARHRALSIPGNSVAGR